MRLCLIGGIVAVFALSTVGAADARAGSYEVVACADDPGFLNRSWSAHSTTELLPAYSSTCRSSDASGLIARSTASPISASVPAQSSALWSFAAPLGATISRVKISARVYRYGGAPHDVWGVGLADETGHYYQGSVGSSSLSGGTPGRYDVYVVPNRRRLQFGVSCLDASGCSVRATDDEKASYTRVRGDLYGASVNIDDAGAPTISSERGALWVSDGWLSGSQTVGFSSADNVGVKENAASFGGQRKPLVSPCDFTRAVPCPTPRSYDASFDTRTVSDGDHLVTLTSTDSAGNTQTESHRALIDNNAPRAPGVPHLSGTPSATWRTTNSFALTYANPSQAGGAPLVSHQVEMCPTDADGEPLPDGCSRELRPGAPETDVVSLPARGRFRFRVRVNDPLFSGAWSDWSPLLRFDDEVPHTPTIIYPTGWVNGAEEGQALVILPPRFPFPRPASSYREYRVRVDGGEQRIVPAVGDQLAGALDYRGLTDGQHTLSVVAVTGAGVVTPALESSLGTVKKDFEPPELSVSGAPSDGAFVRYAVNIRIAGSDRVSGMNPAAAPKPVTDGGYIWDQVNRELPTATRGARSAVAPGDGKQLVQIFASDVAGNHSATASYSYTQDSGAPTGGLRPIIADHPALLDFRVDEQCFGESTVELSIAPGVWRDLATTAAVHRVTALVPSVVWIPRTPYTVRAAVTDCAGNRATLVDWYGGSRDGLPIGTITPPAREVISVAARLAPKSRRSRSPNARRVTAVLVDRRGRHLHGLNVAFQTEPRTNVDHWKTISRAKSNSRGEATTNLAAHSSLRIRAVVAGSELRDQEISNLLYVNRSASTSISASPSKVHPGRSVVIHGRLRGGYVPAEGLELSLYGEGPRSRGWVPIRTAVRVGKDGNWRVTYKFLSTTTRGSFHFRVRIPSRPDYPFKAASSGSVRVRVAR